MEGTQYVFRGPQCFQVALFPNRWLRFGLRAGAHCILQVFLALGKIFVSQVTQPFPHRLACISAGLRVSAFHLPFIKQGSAGPRSTHVLKTHCVHGLDVGTRALGNEDGFWNRSQQPGRLRC